jgi:hypothetical protein
VLTIDKKAFASLNHEQISKLVDLRLAGAKNSKEREA